MPITGIINALVALPAAAQGLVSGASNPVTGGNPNLANTNNGAAGTDPSQLGALAGANGQFAGLLAPTVNAKPLLPNLPTPAAKPGDSSDDNSNSNTQAAVNPAQISQNGNIAIPPISTYIDQQNNAKITLTQNQINDATAASKRHVFDLAELQQQNRLSNLNTSSGNSKIQASDVANSQDAKAQATAATTSGASSNTASTTTSAQQGAIALNNVQEPSSVDEKQFADAVSKIMQQAKQSSANSASKVAAKTADNITASADSHTVNPSMSKAALAQTLAQGQAQASQFIGKIAAKITGIKDDKISDPDAEATAQLNAHLQDFDTQLRNKDFTQIKAATDSIAQSPVDQVQVKISQAAANGLSNIKINLHPAELGSVDVDMDVDHTGNTKIRIVADRQDTLDMLRNNAHDLTKSLSHAGVQADASSLQFSLRGDGNNQGNTNYSNANTNSGNQNNQQQSNAPVTGYSRFSSINEQDLMLTIPTQGLNILV